LSLDGRYWDREFDTRPWAWIESWQAQQLAATLETLPQRSELYRDLLAAAGRRIGLRGYWVSRGRLPTLDMLELVPFTTREQLRLAQQSPPPGRPLGLQQAVPQQYIVQVVSSSGSTGRPVFYGLTRRDHEAWSDAIANTLWTAGIRPDDVAAHLSDRPAAADGWPYADGLRRLGATVVWLGGQAPEQALAALSPLQVTALLTTTSMGAHLAAAADVSGLGVRKVLVGGEPGLDQPDCRRRIADGWGVAHVRDTMGLAGVMAGMWSECDDAGGMHFNAAKYVIVELIDPATGCRVPWADGARGEAVYTTFDRDATPVLRFRSADLLLVTATRCPCGRTSPRVRCLGRVDEARGERAPTLGRVRPLAGPNGGGAADRTPGAPVRELKQHAAPGGSLES
jgi:phenylacetate-coenzyme A ligase PaaK-like adenylate-forming protein